MLLCYFFALQGACCSRATGVCSQVPTLLDCSAGDFLTDKNCQNAGCQAVLPTAACCSATLSSCLGALTQQDCTIQGGRYQDGVSVCGLANCTLPDTGPQNTPDVSITTGLSVDTVLIGGTLEWTITVVNSGEGAANNVKISATLPQGLQYGAVPGETGNSNSVATVLSEYMHNIQIKYCGAGTAQLVPMHNSPQQQIANVGKPISSSYLSILL